MSHFDIAFKKVACMPYLFFLYMKYHFSPLDGLWVHCKVTPPPEFHQGSLIFCQYPFILLGRERHGESEMFYPRIQQNDLAKTQTYTLHLEYSTLTFHSLVKSLYIYVTNMYFTPTAPSTPSSVLEPLSDIWYRCGSGVCSPLCFSHYIILLIPCLIMYMENCAILIGKNEWILM